MDDPRERVRLAFLVFFVLGTLVVGAIYWVRGKLGLTGADLLSLFGEQPLRELDALLKVGDLFQMSMFQLQMPMFQLNHPIFETIDRCRIDLTDSRAFQFVTDPRRDSRAGNEQSEQPGAGSQLLLHPR